ncbi:ATP-binding protein [Streptomyces aureoverticillatus]|uniref:ATP-binding protein n=1 Tax=Streptomyces aureoverticillatus TaxID=66871 RepID=UPI0013DBC82D|nr:tetratricopeptide repeat protein [Streptomyces aureoverticillatus]QIB42941.1 tetratricopeptide repeat protein [Streptomyces aureoverticillatus]
MRGQEQGGHNELGGTVHGPAVQAQTVYGGIHIQSPPAAAQPPHPPWQLPPAARITDRTAELGLLERHRLRSGSAGHGDHAGLGGHASLGDRLGQGGHTLVAVSGLGGVGKTALTLAWLHALRPHFPDGQLYADLGAQSPGGPADPGEVIGRFLRALGVPAAQVPAGLAERAALYRSLTAGRRLVVLLDDAASAAQVRRLLPGGRSVTAVTSRWRMPGLTVDGCHSVRLEPLGVDEAVELLAATLSDDRVADQPEQARALVELCAGLPLAVRVAGARLASRPRRGITTMVRALTEEHDRLEELAIDGDHNVRATLDLTYQELPPDAARLYRLLGLHPGTEFSDAVAVAVLAEPGPSAGAEPGPGAGPGPGPSAPAAPATAASSSHASRALSLLDLLHDANLLTDADAHEDRHRFHDLVRLHAAAKAAQDESPWARAAALRRIADHYLATATRAERIVDPQHRTMARDHGAGPVLTEDFGEGTEAALDWQERELPNLMAVIRRARTAFPTVGWQLADALWPLFLRRKFYEEWRAAHQEGLAAAEDLGDTAAQCRMLTSGGVGELGMGCHERALEMFERAARQFRADGNALGHARTLNYRGLAHQRLGRLDEAARYFTRAAEALPGVGDVRAGGLGRLNLADVALARSRPTEAARHAAAAHTTLRAANDTYNAARAAVLLGRAHLARGEPDLAEAELTPALIALRAMSAAYETARALHALAELAEHRGTPAPARALYGEALTLYAEAGRATSPDARAAETRLNALATPPPQ